jgi:hypothetical protein
VLYAYLTGLEPQILLRWLTHNFSFYPFGWSLLWMFKVGAGRGFLIDMLIDCTSASMSQADDDSGAEMKRGKRVDF